jgi:regulator of ribonuclease activity B/uncharacterized protein DUF695
VSLIGRLLGRRQRWTESWQSFPGAVADAPALWSVDLGAVDAAPISALPARVDVTIGYPAGPDGLPTGHLADAEVAVRTAVDALGGAYVGRVASQGQVRFTAHLPSEPAAGAITGLPEAAVHTEYDPQWAYVLDKLAPDVRQHRLLTDRAMVEALAEAGDTLGHPRPVSHVAYFSESRAAEAAAGELAGAGFATGVEPDIDEGGFALTAVRADPIAPPGVHDLSWDVQQRVERHGGTYDGWTCAVTA